MSAADLEPDEEGPSRRVMLGTKFWPRTIAMIDELAAVRYPDVNPARRKSQMVRDLVSLGITALRAGYVPGDAIPAKRAVVPKRVRQ